MKNDLSFIVAGLMMLSVASVAEASILYRGRLTKNVNGTTSFEEGTTYAMTFRVYSVPQGGAALYTRAVNEVPVRTDGGFEVLLDAPELDAALDNKDRAAYVGLTLEDGRELMPRRQILALPRVVQADTADQLAPAGHFESLKGGNLAAKTVTANELVVGGCLTTQDAKDTLSIRGYDVFGRSLDLRTRKVSVFGDVSVLVTKQTGVTVGQELATAPADGVAFVFAQECQGLPKIPGVSFFCRRGDKICAPATAGGGEKISVRFYAFLVK